MKFLKGQYASAKDVIVRRYIQKACENLVRDVNL